MKRIPRLPDEGLTWEEYARLVEAARIAELPPVARAARWFPPGLEAEDLSGLPLHGKTLVPHAIPDEPSAGE